KSVMRAHAEMQALAAKEEREQGNPLPKYDSPDEARKNATIEQNDEAEEDENDNASKSGKGDR
ncbi:MAG TPA: hypothetical protein PKA58_15870, partial [Polyangium sp.]|nr:hypothetical protein [Polyangium sp.]